MADKTIKSSFPNLELNVFCRSITFITYITLLFHKYKAIVVVLHSYDSKRARTGFALLCFLITIMINNSIKHYHCQKCHLTVI